MGRGRVCPKTSDERVVEVFQDNGHQTGLGKLKRVGAYCRVSTDSDEQQESLENQINAFNHQMMIRDDWKLEKIYVDMKTPSLIQFNDLRRLAGRGGKLRGQGG